MSTRASSQRKDENVQKADKYCIAALLSLSFALFILSVGVFLVNPVGIIGIVSTCIGVACSLLSMLFFALYNHYLRLAEADQ